MHIWHICMYIYSTYLKHEILLSLTSSLIVTFSQKVGAGYGSDASFGQTILVAAEAVVEDYVRTLHYASGFFLFSTYYVSKFMCISVYAFTKDFEVSVCVLHSSIIQIICFVSIIIFTTVVCNCIL